METLCTALYLGGLAFFVFGLQSLSQAAKERRGNICLLIGVGSFAAIIAARLMDGQTSQSVLPFMAGLAIAMAAIVMVNHRFAKWRDHASHH